MIKIVNVGKLPSNHVLSKALIKLRKDHQAGRLARQVVDHGDTVEIHTPMGDTVEIHTPMRKAS